MNELIKVDQSGKLTAKELYEFLGLDLKNYSRWCKANITDNQFAEENKDYFPFVMNEECGAQATTNYTLTIDLAKKLCMVSKSEKGEQARSYFIEVEKRFNSQQFTLPTTFADALRLLATTVEEKELLTQENLLMLPKVEFFDAVADSKTAVPMNEVSKMLAIRGMGRNNLFEFLRDQKILMNNNTPYQKYVDLNYFRVIEQKFMKQGEECITFKTLVYQKGLSFIHRLLAKQAEPTLL